MKRIVLLEDNDYAAVGLEYMIKYELKSQAGQFLLKPINSILMINELIFNDDGSVKEEYTNCCIILDLHMSPEGITRTLAPNDLMFAGWHWLNEHVEILNNDITIIFYSGYVDILCSIYKDECNKLKETKKVFMIGKNDQTALLSRLKVFLSR